jgi:hypothetical protein
MATEPGEGARRPIDPLVAGVRDGVTTGYQALEGVLEGLRESLRQRAEPSGRSGSVARRTAGRRRSGRRAEPLDLVDELATTFAELLSRGGELAQEVAESINEQMSTGPRAGCVPEISLEGVAGEPEPAKGEFSVWNTGATLLREVNVTATDLIGEGRRGSAEMIGFGPAVIPHIAPGRSATVEIGMRIPADTQPGTYRALVLADPGGTCAVLVVTIAAPRDGKAAEVASDREATEPPDSSELA